MIDKTSTRNLDNLFHTISVIILTTILFGTMLVLLTGCHDKDEPREVCIRSHNEVSSRGLVMTVCDERMIACLKPLKLDQRDGKLICRLREPGENE